MQLRTTHDQVEIDGFEDMPESVLITFKLVVLLHYCGVSKTHFVLKDLKALSTSTRHFRSIATPYRQLTERGPQHSYTFLHYAVQEFLTAYHISKLSSEDQSEQVNEVYTPILLA